jgi:hypothetical protein
MESEFALWQAKASGPQNLDAEEIVLRFKQW